MSYLKHPNLLVLNFPMTTNSGKTFVDHYIDLGTVAAIKLGAHDYDLVAIIYNASASHVTCEVLLNGVWVYYDDLDGARLLEKNISSGKLPSCCSSTGNARATKIAHFLLVRRD